MLKLATLLLPLLLSIQSFAQSSCNTLVWSDEFDGSSINTGNWTFETGGGGWGNNELEYYTNRTDNAHVSGGNLYITAKSETYTGPDNVTRNYTSARMKTQGKAHWTYGRFEVRAKLPEGQGLWPAIWMMPNESAYGAWPASGEIDIMELLGNQADKVYGTIHYAVSGTHQQKGGNYTLPAGDFSSDFHIFAVEWDSTSIKWFVDDTQYFSATKAQVGTSWPFNKDFYFILNVAVGGSWPGNPDNTTTFPQNMIVDYARVYQSINGPQASLNGPSTVFENQTSTYSAPYKAGIHYQWTIPQGASLQTPADSSSVTVQWGSTGGNVSVSYTTPCGTQQLQVPVRIISGKCGQVLEDFENIRGTYNYMTGTLDQKAVNPASNNTVNTSATAGKYTRNASEQYDVLILGTEQVGNPMDYVNGVKKWSMDVYSTSPGTTINLQLENNALAAQAYPSGRHSVYVATTTKSNQWETLTFTYNSTPDSTATNIDRISLLFGPGVKTGSVFYIDNLYTYSAGACALTTGLVSSTPIETSFSVFPNPARNDFQVLLEKPATGILRIGNLEGIILQEIFLEYASDIKVPVKQLTPGMYILRIETESGTVQKKLFIE